MEFLAGAIDDAHEEFWGWVQQQADAAQVLAADDDGTSRFPVRFRLNIEVSEMIKWQRANIQAADILEPYFAEFSAASFKAAAYWCRSTPESPVRSAPRQWQPS
jgi:hypothetical protein